MGRGYGEGQYRVGEKRVIMGLHEIICVKLLKIMKHYRDFPGGPLAGTPHSQRREPGFDP